MATNEEHGNMETWLPMRSCLVIKVCLLPQRSSSITQWLIDSGDSSHMITTKAHFIHYKELPTPKKVEAVGIGDIHLTIKFKVSDSESGCARCSARPKPEV